PPVCLAAYAGAGIARANPFQSGVNAVKLAIAAFIIPYIFIYNPLLVGVDLNTIDMILVVGTALIGIIVLSSAMIGQLARDCTMRQRIILPRAGVAVITPGLSATLVGIAASLSIWLIQKQRDDDAGGSAMSPLAAEAYVETAV